MREELLHLGGTQLARVALVMEQDETGNPLDIAILGAECIMPDAQHLMDLVEQAGRPGQRQFAEVEVKHLAVEEVKRLAAGGEGRHRIFFRLGDRLQELADLGYAQLARVPFAVEQDEAEAPIGQGGHARLGMAALPGDLAELVEQARGRGWQRRRLGRCLGKGVSSHDGSSRG